MNEKNESNDTLSEGTFSNAVGDEKPTTIADLIADLIALLSGGAFPVSPEDAALKQESQQLINYLRDRYHGDAGKLAFLAQSVADTATRIAFTQDPNGEWLKTRDRLINRARRSWESGTGPIPYAGTYMLSPELLEKLKAADGDVFDHDTMKALVEEAGEAAFEFLKHELSARAAAWALAGAASRQFDLATGFYRVEGLDTNNKAFRDGCAAAERVGAELAKPEVDEHESRKAGEIAVGASQA